jgi:hypothetical protein
MNNYQRTTERWSAPNSTFAIGGVSCSSDSFVVTESAVLRMTICGEKPTHRKSANRIISVLFNEQIPKHVILVVHIGLSFPNSLKFVATKPVNIGCCIKPFQ